jgi:hypothetical protein
MRRSEGVDVVVDAPASFCCHILMLMFQLHVVDDCCSSFMLMLMFQLHVVDVDVPASCC